MIHGALNVAPGVGYSLDLVAEKSDFRVLNSLSLLNRSSSCFGIFSFHLLNDKDNDVIDLLYFIETLFKGFVELLSFKPCKFLSKVVFRSIKSSN